MSARRGQRRASARARARVRVRVRVRARARARVHVRRHDAGGGGAPRDVRSSRGGPAAASAPATLRDHFGAGTTGPFEVQSVELAGGRSAALVSRADESDPIAIAVDRDQLLWSKPRPTAGILAPVKHLTLSPRPDGGVVVFGWVAALHMVAARMWGDDGYPFGDFELFAPAACDALSAAYGPGLGWIVACASRAGTRAQRLREDGTIAWGQDGATLGATSASGPATIVFDSASSLLVLERVAAVGGDRLLAFRHDANAQPLGPAPLDLGADFVARGPGDSERILARVVRDGVVRVERPRNAAGKGSVRAAEIGPSGDVRYLTREPSRP